MHGLCMLFSRHRPIPLPILNPTCQGSLIKTKPLKSSPNPSHFFCPSSNQVSTPPKKTVQVQEAMAMSMFSNLFCMSCTFTENLPSASLQHHPQTDHHLCLHSLDQEVPTSNISSVRQNSMPSSRCCRRMNVPSLNNRWTAGGASKPRGFGRGKLSSFFTYVNRFSCR